MHSLDTIPLKQLRLSPLNVRRTDPAGAVDELADDIAAHGLLKNLVGHVGAKRGTIEIAAGGRRLQALQLLARRKAIAPDHPVAVLVVPAEDAREISLSENIHRVALNPADEYEGFARIVADHAGDPDPIALCARRQGVSRRRVEQSLRLAELAPEIFDALREGRIGIDAARAYASVTDQALQLTVFREEEGRSWGQKHAAANIRDMLQLKTLDADCPQALYVGLDAYREAGGAMGRDLFLGEARERLFHRGLLDKLAREKALRELPEAVKRDGLAGGLLTRGLGSLGAAAWPPAPAGMRIVLSGSEGLPRRPGECTGVYTLAFDGTGLILVGWFEPVAPEPSRAAPAPEPFASSPAAIRETFFDDRERTPPPHGTGDDHDPTPGLLRLRAAQIAVARATDGVLEGHVTWPPAQCHVPAITPAADDPDAMLVAVLFRVSRAEIEAALPEAEVRLEEEDELREEAAAANDLVAIGEGAIDG